MAARRNAGWPTHINNTSARDPHPPPHPKSRAKNQKKRAKDRVLRSCQIPSNLPLQRQPCGTRWLKCWRCQFSNNKRIFFKSCFSHLHKPPKRHLTNRRCHQRRQHHKTTPLSCSHKSTGLCLWMILLTFKVKKSRREIPSFISSWERSINWKIYPSLLTWDFIGLSDQCAMLILNPFYQQMKRMKQLNSRWDCPWQRGRGNTSEIHQQGNAPQQILASEIHQQAPQQILTTCEFQSQQLMCLKWHSVVLTEYWYMSQNLRSRYCINWCKVVCLPAVDLIQMKQDDTALLTLSSDHSNYCVSLCFLTFGSICFQELWPAASSCQKAGTDAGDSKASWNPHPKWDILLLQLQLFRQRTSPGRGFWWNKSTIWNRVFQVPNTRRPIHLKWR